MVLQRICNPLTGVRFSLGAPNTYPVSSMAEQSADNAETEVRFFYRVPISLASVPVAQGSPKALDGVRFPGERPIILEILVSR